MQGHKKGDSGRIPFGAMLAALRWGDFRQEDVCQSLGLRFVKVDVVRHSSRNFRLHSHEEWVEGCYYEVDEHGRKKFAIWEGEWNSLGRSHSRCKKERGNYSSKHQSSSASSDTEKKGVR